MKPNCIECAHWKSTGKEHCGLYSLTCTNSKTHPNFLGKSEVKFIPKIRLNQGGRNKVKGQTAFINGEELSKALQSRARDIPMYPDMRQLTDESKKELRRIRRRK